MLVMRKRLACCTRTSKISTDFDHDHQARIMTYDGLESCILDNQSSEDESRTSRGDGCITDSFNDEWELSQSPQHFYVKEKPAYAMQCSDVEAMREKFSKLLLGDDITGGTKGLNTALALSNAISSLSVTVFGELWKLEPLPEERKSKWQREMDWLLSPTNYMVELVPAKQNAANGGIFEIMTPKARSDVHMNLPALQKLDSMLIETLESMVNTEFWYEEGGSRAERRSTSVRQSKRWWLPSPQVPSTGLSDTERKRLIHRGRVVHQIFKAAKSINDNILLEMPVPTIIKDALLKSGKASLGEELHMVLTAESSSGEEMLKYLNLKTEHKALETVNKLEAAMFSWKERMRITQEDSGKSPLRTSWPFMKDSMPSTEKVGLWLDRAQTLLKLLKSRYPNLPQTFLDAAKVQYGKDIGHSILEAYSRVLASLALSILSRIGDILQEDALSNPNSPMASINSYSPGTSLSESWVASSHVKHSLIDKMNKADVQYCESSCDSNSDLELSSAEAKANSVTSTPSRNRVWCIGREACKSVSP
ncbi:rop guanine nucleotide exchange factor 14-like [Arachis duranensis]|uniref:Rop guanine nucleotide exchange factor 14-like n=1 Tax=Arachis duranensis TaxID=130453 RepID=A0A6P5N5U5_ARADU|nr:rop guanine nucleotide exchange factor 14-like [Arachis duranensis]XP_052111959.1 rop guanine nucleotide exchange factor 14-like [Arachis duranensis]XP_052111960.1 rop guanine nucleotide exchange factor 14-like [Arachis duranensis]XP_052116086.1 rop guanine nucleotide exchange factor 14-like [Arachis duranensis]XP_052116359.1 rop guanine nucleotide exchange factor 14-like [Arachis duranensis]XP_052116491.1 rop guanine nucleotide exchange factor 14-like [Arachis duranensis]